MAHPFHGLRTLPANPRTAKDLTAQSNVLASYGIALAQAVRDHAPADIHLALDELDRQQITSLAVTLAAMVDDRANAGELLAWTDGLVAGSQIPIAGADQSKTAA
jgi:hypothetical protein